MARPSNYSPEVRERVVRLVQEHTAEHGSQWEARGRALTTDGRQQLKALQRENTELKRANEILRKAAAFFRAGELDRRPK